MMSNNWIQVIGFALSLWVEYLKHVLVKIIETFLVIGFSLNEVHMFTSSFLLLTAQTPSLPTCTDRCRGEMSLAHSFSLPEMQGSVSKQTRDRVAWVLYNPF